MHIILYVLDALRPDHLSCYGYGRETSPHIDALSREGALFKNCFAPATWTRPVAASILTGSYPGVHMTRTRQDMFTSDLPRLPQVLKRAGVTTAGFSAMGNVASDAGFDLGFDQYYDIFRDPTVLAKRRVRYGLEEALMHAKSEKIGLPRAEDVNETLFRWLDENQRVDTLNFVWSIETHAPYTAPNAFRRFSEKGDVSRPEEGGRDDIRSAGPGDRQRLINLYDDEIYYNDYCIGEIVRHLKELEVYDDSLFIITGDHGEAFYEHEAYGHGHAPYDELIRVPLIIKFPHGKFAGVKVSGMVELIDIAPTAIAVAGIQPVDKASSFVQGYNLSTLLNGDCDEVRQYVFSDTQSLEIQNRFVSVRSSRWKYIQVHRPKRNRRTLAATLKHIVERQMVIDVLRNSRHFLHNYFTSSNEYLFDLQNDPEERNNLVRENSEILSQLREVLANWQKKNEELSEQVQRFDFRYREDEAIRKHLEELGYM
jgi:arylsulfatase A-like enzyme